MTILNLAPPGLKRETPTDLIRVPDTLTSKGVKAHAKQPSSPPEREGHKLPSQTELLILWAVSNSGGRGVYGLDIQRAITECSGGNESISVGTLYSILKRLRKKGLVDSYEGDSIAGGAKRQYYHLTATGESVVNYSNDFISRLSGWTPSYEAN